MEPTTCVLTMNGPSLSKSVIPSRHAPWGMGPPVLTAPPSPLDPLLAIGAPPPSFGVAPPLVALEPPLAEVDPVTLPPVLPAPPVLPVATPPPVPLTLAAPAPEIAPLVLPVRP